MPRRVAVVGAGPKGLYCLERLAGELRLLGGHADLEVHIFEPHPYPGAGPVYDPTQPDYLRMNFANGKVDMWSRDDDPAGQPDPSRQTFVEYLAASGLPASEADYAPRRLVGTYLNGGFNHIVSALNAHAAVRIHREAVQAIEKRGSEFLVRSSTQSVLCNEVLLATGHGSRISPRSAKIFAYPVDRPGGVSAIPSGSTVAVRGLGLTAIDVALALTEGRGGRFVATDLPGQVKYQASGQEVYKVFPYSRTGRPMVPKPHPVLMPETEAVMTACEEGSKLIDQITVAGKGSVLSALVHTSASILQQATGHDGCEALVRQHLEALLSRDPITEEQALTEMREAVETAFGLGLPSPDWALGVAWRGIYPALVRLAGARGLDESWSSFSPLATEMERVAFGPPAENAARMVALTDAGILDMSCAANPFITEQGNGVVLNMGTVSREIDVLVDAVLDPPGAAPHPAPVMASLLEAGLARTTNHSAGIDVLADGTCVNLEGDPTVGLAAVGRPTEGSILGNDTLSRRLHDTPALWAQTVVRRLCPQTESSAA